MKDISTENRRTYPLSLLFLILTCAAVLAAAAAPMIRNIDLNDWRDSIPALVGAIGASMICGAVLGVLIGLFQFEWRWGVICGAAIGALLGPFVGLLLTVRRENVGALVQVVATGSALIVLIAWLIRPGAPPEEEPVVNAVLAPPPPSPPQQSAAKNPFAD